MFDDSGKHESLQMKMGKKSLQQNDTLVKSAVINIDQLLQNLEFQRTPSQQRKEDGHSYPVAKDTVHLAWEITWEMKSTTFFTAQILTSSSPLKVSFRELYRINTNNSLINASPKDITQWVL